MFLKISQNSHASAGVSFFAKVADWTTSTLMKRDSSKFCEIPNYISFTENH